MMNILFTICGRAGSKGIKNKNIRPFLEYPLPLYTFSAIDLYLSRHTGISADIALNTDSEELIAILKKEGRRTISLVNRKEELAVNSVPKTVVVRDTYLEMKDRKQCDYDIIVDMDITSPLRTVKDVENAIARKKETNCDVVFTVTESRRNPYFNMVKETECGYQRIIQSGYTARQQVPECFDMNASIYVYDPVFLMSGKGLFDSHCEITQMMDTGILDLDNEHDLELLQVIAQYLFSSKEAFAEVYNHIKAVEETG